MINGLYNSASGMNVELAKQEAIANNIANVNTTGYKKDEAVFKAFPMTLVNRIHDRLQLPSPIPQPFVNQNPVLGIVGHGAALDGVVTDFSDGTYQSTDRRLDLALEGNAFFTLGMQDGSRGYTRAGSFTLNEEGNLMTHGGDTVLSRRNGPIHIDGKEVMIDPQGRVIVDGIQVDELLLTSFDKEHDLVKRGESVFLSADEQGLNTEPGQLKATVKQGYLENPNVTVVKEMVDMISVMRAYEANQKAIQSQDATLAKAVNEVGRV